ncbi:type II toxin-antitoxin system RelE/ParE family toxin [Dyadobacter sp. Leaf189]|uniref:type II toxin-antitoxin system RelE/ParE family toxin n=1 Tax=Dyadobacter sp. Leaf189 TaxID=1736295 RepID=UPI0006F23FBE|nr:type II toxin-antitoxin system RelE/ParE family toxin [Dyadobacter sp. Leaf189]
MSLPVVWTFEAETGFAEIIGYLEDQWTEREVKNFIHRVKKIVKHIAAFPQMFEASPSSPRVRKAVLSKQQSLFYQIEEDRIVLLSFWDNRREPKVDE